MKSLQVEWTDISPWGGEAVPWDHQSSAQKDTVVTLMLIHRPKFTLCSLLAQLQPSRVSIAVSFGQSRLRLLVSLPRSQVLSSSHQNALHFLRLAFLPTIMEPQNDMSRCIGSAYSL